MALAKISEFTLFTMTPDLNSTLKKLQSLKIAQIEKLEKGDKSPSAETDEINRKINLIQNASKTAEKYRGEKNNNYTNILKASEKIIEADKRISKLKDEIKEKEKQIINIIPYKGGNYPLRKQETLHTTACFGYIVGKIPETDKNVFIHILKQEKNKTYVWMLAKKPFVPTENFNEFYSNESLTPSQMIEKLYKDIEINNRKINELENEISKLSSVKGSTELKKLFYQKELEEEKTKLTETEKTTVISGYILTKNIKILKKHFPDSAIIFSEAGENAPVAFINNPLVSPVEGITESYTMPSSQDIDPNPVMAFFYYLFFGMMFSDAGYGLMMILVCGYAGFFMKTKITKMLRMFFFCGISTFFWGLMYGSFFGNAITSVSEIFFGRTIILMPLWINPTDEPLTLLILSIALGFLQIITGLCLKLYIQIKHKRVKEGIFDTGSWILTLSGLGILSAGLVATPLIKAGIFLSVAGVIMLITTQGRHKKNVFLKIASGFLSLYNITSYISDILSYSRLMALGLATGVIAEVVNILGGLGGNSYIGVIMYVLVFIIGHGLNFAINMLGAYVHTNRLQYVEFYSKFYEGGGKAFIPFGSRY